METTAIATQSNDYLVVRNIPAVLSIDSLDNAINVFLSFQQVNNNTPETYRRALHQFLSAKMVERINSKGDKVKWIVGWVYRTGRTIPNLTRADLLSYIQDMKSGNNMFENAPLTPHTINSYLTVIRRFYSFCELYNIATNIAKGTKGVPTTDEHEKSDFTTTQAANILTAAQDNRRDFAIMSLMMRCGLRTIEVVRANIGDIELMGDTYVLTVHGKRDKKRYVPMTPKTWAAINDYLLNERRGAKDNEPLFTSAAHQCKGDRLTTRSVSRIAKNNIIAVGINDSRHTAHSCRHTALGCIVSEQNPDTNKMQTAQTLAGHSDPATTYIYVKQQMQRDFLRSAPNRIIDTMF